MRRIRRLEWDEHNEEHIARHGVSPEEVEEVCFARPMLVRSRQGSHVALGQTHAGRHLVVVLRFKAHGLARCITARNMTDKEKRYYRRRSTQR